MEILSRTNIFDFITVFIYLTSKANFIMKIVHQAQLLMAFSPTQSGRPFEFGWRTQFPLLLPQTCLRPLWSPALSGVWSLASEYNNIYLLCSLSDLEAADPILTRWLFSTVHISFFLPVHVFFSFTVHIFSPPWHQTAFQNLSEWVAKLLQN